MKRIWQDLKTHVREDFDVKRYGAVGLMLATLIFFNYRFDLEVNFQAKLNPWEYLGFYLVFFPVIYYLTVFLSSGQLPFRKKDFLLTSGLFLLLLCVNTGFLFHRSWIADLSPHERHYLRNILINSIGSFIILVPLFGFYLLKDRAFNDSFYGLSLKNHNFKPYLTLLLLMVPLIGWAATQADFMATYPIFKPWKYQEVFGLSLPQMTWLFEFVYLFDFIRVETIFRGALVIGVSRFLGKQAILPMVALYCVLHFNKPMMETISSIFGGYLLGTIAYYQKNIVGGCIVHAGIAGLMEAMAWLAL